MLVDVTKIKLVWESTGDVIYPYQATLGESTLKIRLNDFPEEIMYSLLIDNQDMVDFEDWPQTWKKLG